MLPLLDPSLLEAAERPGGLFLSVGGGENGHWPGLQGFLAGLYLGGIAGSGGSAGDIHCRPARDSCDDGDCTNWKGSCVCVIENSLNYLLPV